MDELQRPAEVASYIQRSEKMLAQWRYLGRGPRYIKLEGGHIRYRRSDVDAWLASCERGGDPREAA